MAQMFLGIWEQDHNASFNYVEFAIIKSRAWLNCYRASDKRRVTRLFLVDTDVRKLEGSRI